MCEIEPESDNMLDALRLTLDVSMNSLQQLVGFESPLFPQISFENGKPWMTTILTP
jgi:hypothetical protein